MGNSIDFSNQKSGRGNHGEPTDSTDESSSSGAHHEYLHLLPSSTSSPRFVNTALYGADYRYRSSTSYPNPPVHQQCIPSNSSSIPNNEINGLMSDTILQSDINSQVYFEPERYALGGSVPAFVELSPEFPNLGHPQQYPYLASSYNDFSSTSTSGLQNGIRDPLSAVSA